ncbi:MAG: 4'-phosphopantetheinyl transferase family protein [Bacteroidota bacterium]|jgi:phosphopantetheinyl transferase
MPLYAKETFDNNTILALWKITESREEFMQLHHFSVQDISSRNKESMHWYASRVLIKCLFPNEEVVIMKDEHNKPSLMVGGKAYHISITHSHQMAAVIVSPVKLVAIDLELIDNRVDRVSKKFVGIEELKYLDSPPSTEALTTIWSAKESLYKLNGKRGIDFRLNLFIEPFIANAQQLNGFIILDDNRWKYTIEKKLIDDYILTYIIAG